MFESASMQQLITQLKCTDDGKLNIYINKCTHNCSKIIELIIISNLIFYK